MRMRIEFRTFFCVLCVNCCVVCDSREQRHAGGFRALPIVEVSCIISLHSAFDSCTFRTSKPTSFHIQTPKTILIKPSITKNQISQRNPSRISEKLRPLSKIRSERMSDGGKSGDTCSRMNRGFGVQEWHATRSDSRAPQECDSSSLRNAASEEECSIVSRCTSPSDNSVSDRFGLSWCAGGPVPRT